MSPFFFALVCYCHLGSVCKYGIINKLYYAVIHLRCIGILSGEVTLSFTMYIFSSLLKRAYSQKKEYAPLRENPSLQGLCHLGK